MGHWLSIYTSALKAKKFKIICSKNIVLKIILCSKMNEITKAGANRLKNEEQINSKREALEDEIAKSPEI